MKKTLFLLLSVCIFVLASCGNDEPKPFQIKDTDMIAIKPASGVAARAPMRVKATEAHLSALEIVKQVGLIMIRDTKDGIWSRSFIQEQRDTISSTPKLLMWATDVISLDGNLQSDFLGNFLEAKDVVFVRCSTTMANPNFISDTIAYIPNSVLRAAETSIRKAFADKNIDECYRIFNEAYTFVPITGAEWRALKTNGNN